MPKDNQEQSCYHLTKQIDESLLEQSKKKDLPIFSPVTITIITGTILSCSCYSVIAPFMPAEIVRKEIDEVLAGYIFASFSIAVIIGSPCMSWVIQKFGRRWPIIIGSFLIGVSSIVLALLPFLESKRTFVVLCFVARLVEGASYTLIQVTCLSIAATFYPNQKEILLGILEASGGVGLVIGPLIGTALFTLGGYTFMLLTFGITFLIFSACMPFFLPRFLDQHTNFEEQTIQNIDPSLIIQNVPFWSLFLEPSFTMACLAQFLCNFQWNYLGPILGLHLLKNMGLTESQVGLFFSIDASTYIVACLLVTKLPKTVKKKVWIILGVLLSFPKELLIGPSQIFGFPSDSILMIGIGQALFGVTSPLILVFVLPEMIGILELKHPHLDEKRKSQLIDMTSSTLNLFVGLAQISGPIFGSECAKRFGYRPTVDIVAVGTLIMGLIYFFIADGFSAFKKSKFI